MISRIPLWQTLLLTLRVSRLIGILHFVSLRLQGWTLWLDFSVRGCWHWGLGLLLWWGSFLLERRHLSGFEWSSTVGEQMNFMHHHPQLDWHRLVATLTWAWKTLCAEMHGGLKLMWQIASIDFHYHNWPITFVSIIHWRRRSGLHWGFLLAKFSTLMQACCTSWTLTAVVALLQCGADGLELGFVSLQWSSSIDSKKSQSMGWWNFAWEESFPTVDWISNRVGCLCRQHHYHWLFTRWCGPQGTSSWSGIWWSWNSHRMDSIITGPKAGYCGMCAWLQIRATHE